MNDERTSSRPTLQANVWTDIQGRLDRIEDKLDTRLNTVAAQLDSVAERQSRLEGQLAGSIGMIRWIGPAGVIALIIGLLRTSGVL